MNRKPFAHLIGSAILFLAGCQVDPKPDYERANQLIHESTSLEAVQDPEEHGPAPEEIDLRLADGLGLDEALRLALSNSRRLQSSFLEIGLARADWLQSGLLSNPNLGLALLFPEGGGRSNLQVSLAQNIVDLWQLPVKRRIAERELERTILQIARLAGELTNDTKRSYYGAVAQDHLARLAEENLAVLSKSYDAIRVQRGAGSASALDENLARGEMLQAQLAVCDARLRATNARRELARLLSIEADLRDITLVDPLPAPTALTLDADGLITLAREKRLDLKAVRQAVDSSDEKIRLEYLKVFPEITVGPYLERMERRAQPGRTVLADFARASVAAGTPTVPEIQTPGQRRAEESQEIDTILGPTISMTLPVFDQNQAQTARARFAHIQAVKSYEELQINIAQDIRIAADRAAVVWTQVEFYHDELIPQASRNVEFAEISYKAGNADVLTLLQAQRTAIQVRQAHFVTWSEAATAWADLELAVGMPLKEVTSRSDTSEQSSRGRRNEKECSGNAGTDCGTPLSVLPDRRRWDSNP